MSHQSRSGRRRASVVVATVAALAVAGLAGRTSYAVGSVATTPSPSTTSPRAAHGTSARGFYDVRTSSAKARAAALHTVARVQGRSGVQSRLRTVGTQPITDIDGNTGTVRMRTSLDGFLTGASRRSAAGIALGYVGSHLGELGLIRGDLNTFHLARTYRDIAGIRHLYFRQRVGGRAVIGNGLTAAVDKAGHLLTVGGSPVSKGHLSVTAPGTSAKLATAGAALATARGAVTPGSDTSQDGVTHGLFVTGTTARPAWEAVVMSAKSPVLLVLDARTGAVLQRHPLVNYESGDATARVFRFFPGAHRGGRQVTVDLTKHHWLPRSARTLHGNNSHAYSDVNGNDKPSATEEVRAKSGHAWSYRLTPFHLRFARSFCSNPWPCSWNPNKAFSWRTNRAQNATQVFYFVNNWHDHLQKAPIGFTEAAGNFQTVNHTKKGQGGDAVNTETDDGANTAHGLPDGNHIDNANMATPPDGRHPRMQMYLQHQPFTPYPAGDPFSPTNVGDEADTVYHEYTHGLSNRLNVDVQGRSTLGGVQAGAMGEAWSDWYAMDYLVDQGLQRDVRGKADVRLFRYDGEGVNLDRTEPIDCATGQHVRLCNGGATGHRGGYTYRDYGHVVGLPEVHGDGEIWAQTLWSLRNALGSRKSESLVTRAMELAPYNPSFLDMRNAILVANRALYAGRGQARIWQVFANRGMGFFAGSLGGDDTTPGWSFATPPAAIATGSISGTITDADTHLPVSGLPVTLAFQGSGPANPTTTTAADGTYTLSGIPQGTYNKLQVFGQAYSARRSVTVGAGVTTVNFDLHQDLAATSVGATVGSQTGAVFQGCAPAQALDLDQATGWSTNIASGTNVAPSGTFHSKNMVVDLGGTFDLSGFGIDPSASCGDGGSASTGDYRIEVAANAGGPWTLVKDSTFTTADDGRINQITPDVPALGVEFVRFTMDSNQVPDFTTNCPNGAFAGCVFVDLTELQVYGKAS